MPLKSVTSGKLYVFNTLCIYGVMKVASDYTGRLMSFDSKKLSYPFDPEEN